VSSADSLPAPRVLGRFRLINTWKTIDSASADDLVAFWLRESALPSEERARERLSEVVLYARDETGAVCAVCTAYVATLASIGQPMYHYRSFVGAAWRNTTLARSMLLETVRFLADYAAAHDFPCVGVVMELENPRFRDALSSMPVWRAAGARFVFIGKSSRGFDLRIHYFRGARLKPASTLT